MLKLRSRAIKRDSARRGQTLTELALVAPLFFMMFFGIIVFGMAVFFGQQLTNAAREGARYAAIHSATSRCPTVSNREPDPALLPLPNTYSATCDPPSTRWPKMTAHARNNLFGLDRQRMQVTACWSGYWVKVGSVYTAWDQVARDPLTGQANEFRDCTVQVFGWCPNQSGASTQYALNPRTGLSTACAANGKVSVDCSKPFPLTTATDDMASAYAASNATNANQVTVVTCYAWDPPLAGFLMIPSTHSIVGVVTESLEYQQ